MTENAQRIWIIATAAGYDSLLEQYVDDLEAFAADLKGASEPVILYAIYMQMESKRIKG